MKPYESNSVERWSLDHYTERQIILYSKEKRERETGPEVACQLDWDQNRH